MVAEHAVAGEPENVIDAILLAPIHGLGPGVMAVAAPADAGLGPMAAQATGNVLEDGADLGAARRLARPQDDRHRLARTGLVNVDRQETALVVMGIEERELLMCSS